MPQRTITTVINVCARCGYEWAQRKDDEKPLRCAGCRSPYWDKEKTRGKKDK